MDTELVLGIAALAACAVAAWALMQWMRKQAEVAELLTRLAAAEERLVAAEDRLDRERTVADDRLQRELTAAEERLQRELAAADEKVALLAEARTTMSAELRLAAEEVMTRHGETLRRQNGEQVAAVLEPLRSKLVEFQEGMQRAQVDGARERAGLAAQLRQLGEMGAKMTQETTNLTRALKGQSQTQGAWGEMVLGTILERSGLREGEEYLTQESHTLEDGSRLRPDVIVKLPGDQRVVIDSKVSLLAFEMYVNADSDGERSVHLASHARSLKQHIRELGAKDYASLPGSALDYVILFVPIEGALAAALQAEPELTAMATEHDVVIATPTTLMIALRTIHNLWQVERQNKNAELIAARAGKLYDKLVGFVEDLKAVETSLARARGSYDAAMSKLATGKGNVLRQAEQLKELGAKTTKALPAELLDDDTPQLPAAGAA